MNANPSTKPQTKANVSQSETNAQEHRGGCFGTFTALMIATTLLMLW